MLKTWKLTEDQALAIGRALKVGTNGQFTNEDLKVVLAWGEKMFAQAELLEAVITGKVAIAVRNGQLQFSAGNTVSKDGKKA